MNKQTHELIAIGASVGAHCQPCLEYHIKAALKLGVEMNEIQKAVEIGHQVEKGAMTAMKTFSENLLKESSAECQTAKKTLQIYDPAMCCSSGVCGSQVDPVLANFAGTVQAITKEDSIVVERYNLAQQPQAFVTNEQVKLMLADGGDKRLPFIFLNGTLIFQERYPSKEELFAALGLCEEISAEEPEGCGCDGGCCG